MMTTIKGQSVTCTYTPADGAPETKIFDVFIPEGIARPRIGVLAGCVGDIVASDPKNVIISEVENGAKQLTKAVLDKIAKKDPSLRPQLMPVRAKRYHGSQAAAELTVEKDFDTTPGALEGKTVIIIDEVVDTAVVAQWSIKRARELGAKTVIFVTLANKPAAIGRREIAPDLFLIGFDNIPGWAFLLGWGMDWHEDGRELTAIYRERDPRHASYTVPDLPARVLQAA